MIQNFQIYMDTVQKIVGANFVERNEPPVMGSEDFADMLKHTREHTAELDIQRPNRCIIQTMFLIQNIPIGHPF